MLVAIAAFFLLLTAVASVGFLMVPAFALIGLAVLALAAVAAVALAVILLDDGSVEETEADIRSTDPLGFPEYPQRLKRATANAGLRPAVPRR